MNSPKTFDVQTVLELSCAAHRLNGTYIKEHEILFSKTGNRIYSNKFLILHTLGLPVWNDKDGLPPRHLKILNEDREMADTIRNYFRRLTFAVIEGSDNVFDSSIHSILNRDEMDSSETGYVAYLPTKYLHEYSENKVEKTSKTCDNLYLGEPDQTLFDLDSEIVEIRRSKNYDAWNITAIINNKMCSWMTNDTLSFGPAVIIRAKIKEHSRHWKYNNKVTRLNYVKAAQ